MNDTPTQWAIDRVREMADAEMKTQRVANWSLACSDAFARYIERYEQPPADPDEEALLRIFQAGWPHFKNISQEFENCLAQYKKEIGRE